MTDLLNLVRIGAWNVPCLYGQLDTSAYTGRLQH